MSVLMKKPNIKAKSIHRITVESKKKKQRHFDLPKKKSRRYY